GEAAAVSTEGGASASFDANALRERVRRAAPGSGAEREVAAGADALAGAVRAATADATRAIFRYGTLVVGAALLLTLGIPELPLRRHHGPPPDAAAAH
ncbi:MAG: hypothetical protein ACJ8AO_03460, partial [Gemmatimonadaceae bacterium]